VISRLVEWIYRKYNANICKSCLIKPICKPENIYDDRCSKYEIYIEKLEKIVVRCKNIEDYIFETFIGFLCMFILVTFAMGLYDWFKIIKNFISKFFY